MNEKGLAKTQIHTCYACLHTGIDEWTFDGYDEFGELWRCSKCRPEKRDSLLHSKRFQTKHKKQMKPAVDKKE